MSKIDNYISIAIAVCLVALIGVVGISVYKNAELFKQACAEKNGKAVYDGRQYQCLEKK